MWRLSSPIPKGLGFRCYFAKLMFQSVPNCAGILQPGTSLHVASSWLASLNCWALPFQGRLCPAMVSSTWLILSPRGKSIQKGASLGKFSYVFFYFFLLLFFLLLIMWIRTLFFLPVPSQCKNDWQDINDKWTETLCRSLVVFYT